MQAVTVFTMSDGSHPKYLSRVGDKPRAFFPPATTLEMLSDPKINVVITEGEYKTLAIAEAQRWLRLFEQHFIGIKCNLA
jgi:hypothetical protein